MNTINRAASLQKMAQDFATVSAIYDGTGATDIYPLLAELRAKSPVMEGDILRRFEVPSQADYANCGRPVYTVFRYNDVVQVLRDPENWLSSLNGDGFGPAVDGFLMTAMDGEPHREIRSLLQGPFMINFVKKWMDTLVRPIIEDKYVNVLRHNGKADLLLEFGLPFPVHVIYSMFGFPEDPSAAMKFAGWALQILAAPQFDPEKAKISGAAAMVAAQQLYEHVLPIIAARRASGLERDDLFGFLMNADFRGKKFTDHDIATFVRMLLLAAGETTSRTFANMMVLLLKNPDVMDRLRQDRTLIPKAINETMRLETTAGHLARLAAKDMVISGVTIPKGTAVSLCISSANRDPEVYVNPDKLDLDRPLKPIISFGFGAHVCMGMHIARVEIEAAVNALLDLPNLRLDPDYPEPVIRGMQLRGPDQLHVVWDV